MAQLGVEQQFVLLSQRLGSVVRAKLRAEDLAGARREVEEFADYVFAREVAHKAPERGRRLETDPPPASDDTPSSDSREA